MTKEEIINEINKNIETYGEYETQRNSSDKHFLNNINVKILGNDYYPTIKIEKNRYLVIKNNTYIEYLGIKKCYLKRVLEYLNRHNNKPNLKSKSGIIVAINNIIKEYGEFSSYDIDKYLTIDELKCGRVYVVTKNYELDKVYCEILFCEDVLDEEYYDYNILNIEVLKEILEYCNI